MPNYTKSIRITDVKLIPREYLVPDETAIRNAMKANLPVKGVEFYEESVPFNSR